MLHMAVETAFDDLLATWRTHCSRQANPQTAIADLAQSRAALDRARNRMHQLRIAIYPETDEEESIVESLWCETLETVVHLRWVDQDPVRPGNYRCVCGHLVPVNWDLVAKRDQSGAPFGD